MKELKPYIYWFGFEDSSIPNSDEQSNIYFYQTVILALSPDEALSWGDSLAEELVKNGRAVSIHSSWIEDVIPKLITSEGSKQIDWERISSKELEQFYQVTTSSLDKSHRNINAFIYSKNEKDARTLFNHYLKEHKLNYKIETCSKPAISITKVGMSVDWL